MTFQKTDHLSAPSQGAAAKPAANPPSAGRSSGFDPVTGANTRAGGMKFNHISDLVQHHVSRVGVETGGVVGAATKSAGIAALNMPDLATRSASLGNPNLAKAVAKASSPLNKLSTPVVSALSNATSLVPGVAPAKQAAAALEKTAETAVKAGGTAVKSAKVSTGGVLGLLKLVLGKLASSVLPIGGRFLLAIPGLNKLIPSKSRSRYS